MALVARGLEASRERARRLIVAGEVTVDGQVARAPSTLVAEDAALAIGKTLPYVSRGGFKLAHALDRFGVDPAGRTCLDAGASTGGFTDVLLQRGAARVYAADVGKGLLAWTLRQDPRVVVMEGVNVRHLRLATGMPAVAAQETLTEDSRPHANEQSATTPTATNTTTGDTAPTLPESVGLVVADLAFISLRVVLPALASVLSADGDLMTLVKPQFEAGQADVGKGGVVRRPEVHRRVLREVLDAVRGHALTPAGLTASPIRGQAGNVEFLLWARRITVTFPELDDVAAIDDAIAEAPSA